MSDERKTVPGERLARLRSQRSHLGELLSAGGYAVCEYQIRPADAHHSQCRECGHSLDAHCYLIQGPCTACLTEIAILVHLEAAAAVIRPELR